MLRSRAVQDKLVPGWQGMSQSVALDTADLNGKDSTFHRAEAESGVPCVPVQRAGGRGATWLADLEPLSILIQAVGSSWSAWLLDRRIQCSVELPVEFDLESTKRAALLYANEYMHVYVGEASWTMPATDLWHEFTFIRSPEDLEQRRSAMAGPAATSSLCFGAPLRKAKC